MNCRSYQFKFCSPYDNSLKKRSTSTRLEDGLTCVFLQLCLKKRPSNLPNHRSKCKGVEQPIPGLGVNYNIIGVDCLLTYSSIFYNFYRTKRGVGEVRITCFSHRPKRRLDLPQFHDLIRGLLVWIIEFLQLGWVNLEIYWRNWIWIRPQRILLRWEQQLEHSVG